MTCKHKNNFLGIIFFELFLICFPSWKIGDILPLLIGEKSSFIAGTLRLCYNDAHKIERER